MPKKKPINAWTLLQDAHLKEILRAFFLSKSDSHASFYQLKQTFFMNTTYAHMKAYFRSQVDTYMIIGQKVLLIAQVRFSGCSQECK